MISSSLIPFSDSAFDAWRIHAPSFSGSFEHDAPVLSAHLERAEGWLGTMGSKRTRTVEKQRDAELIHQACRVVRGRFLDRHVEALYHELTSGYTRRPGLVALAAEAAQRVPHLLPSEAQMADERALTQTDKEGREIDQGIFFGALLRSDVAGRHLVDSMLLPGKRALGLIEAFKRSGVVRLDTLEVRRQDGAAQITVLNGHSLNAEDNDLIADMETAVDLALLDPAVKVGILRGGAVSHPKYAGRRVFSAGINLKHLRDGKISFVQFLLQRELGYISKILRGALVADGGALLPLEKPWVAAVDSFAIGGGAQLLLVFDSVIAEAGSFFSLPAAREGIVPGVANLRLGRAVGSRMARQVILGGRRILASEPAGALVFDEVVDGAAMDEVIARHVDALSSPAAVPNRRMLTLGEEPVDAFRMYMAEFAPEQALRLYSPDVIGNL
jgi:thioesterase DpgC